MPRIASENGRIATCTAVCLSVCLVVLFASNGECHYLVPAFLFVLPLGGHLGPRILAGDAIHYLGTELANCPIEEGVYCWVGRSLTLEIGVSESSDLEFQSPPFSWSSLFVQTGSSIYV